jgi:ligand-binding SRPBCC domain-containing protein
MFRSGLGGKMGDGNQIMSWIHFDDLLATFLRALEDPEFSGPVEAVGPAPVTNQVFVQTLGKVLGRPAALSVPARILRTALGEMSTIVLGGVEVRPAGPMAQFPFRFDSIESALRDLCTGGDEFLSWQWVPRQVESVFEFFSQARNLEAMTPPWLHFRIEGQPPEVLSRGTRLNYRLRVHGIPVRWQTQITDWSPPQRFEDVQEKGPYALWRHQHEFVPVHGGTLMLDRVRYELPAGGLGRLIAGGIVRDDIEEIFAFRRGVAARTFA